MNHFDAFRFDQHPAREKMVRQQRERNQRLKPVRRSERKRIRSQAQTVFRCDTCRRDVVLKWETLSQDCGVPTSRECGAVLRVVTACLNKSVLPRL
jgi:hypothetical protein